MRPLLLVLVLLLAGCQSPGAFLLSQAGASDEAPFSAGVATVDYTPEGGYPLGGYGGGARRSELPFYAGMGWPGRIALSCHQAYHEDDPEGRADLLTKNEGAHEEIGARALVLRPEGAPPLAFVRIDAIGVTSEIHDLALAHVRDLGYRRDTLILSATHTHSGPGAIFRAPLARLIAMDNYRQELEASIAAAIGKAIRQAHQAAVPAALAFARARDRDAEGATLLAKNRRHRRFRGEIAYDELDDEVGLLALVQRESREPIALLLNYAVHPTVLGSDSLHYSRDLAGGVERGLEQVFGAPVLFLNGAEGDIGPRQLSQRGGMARCEELGEAFAALLAPSLAELSYHERISLRTALGHKELGDPRGVVALGRERFLDGEASWASWPMELINLPFNLVLWTFGLTNVRVVLTWNLALGVVAHLDGLTPRTTTRIGALRLRAGEEDVVFLSVPGEATHDVGLATRELARSAGASRCFIAGLTFDHIGYIASRREYRRGGYEAHSTLFGQGTAAQVLESHRALLGALGYEGPATKAAVEPQPDRRSDETPR